jgi:hypothetical protein
LSLIKGKAEVGGGYHRSSSMIHKRIVGLIHGIP